VDFCGWPGDNECGGAIYEGVNGNQVWLFESFDGGLKPSIFPDLMFDYYSRRTQIVEKHED